MDFDKKGISVFPETTIRKLLPDLSPLHRWMHGKFKNWVREFVNKYAESREMQEILARKLGSPGWINPEIKVLWDLWEELIEKEKIVWQNTGSGNVDKDKPEINRNERFWKNLRVLVCITLDEDSYYVVRFFYFLELLFANQDKFNIEYHKKRAYWNLEEFKLKLKAEAERKRLEREGWKFGSQKTENNSGFEKKSSA